MTRESTRREQQHKTQKTDTGSKTHDRQHEATTPGTCETVGNVNKPEQESKEEKTLAQGMLKPIQPGTRLAIPRLHRPHPHPRPHDAMLDPHPQTIKKKHMQPKTKGGHLCKHATG